MNSVIIIPIRIAIATLAMSVLSITIANAEPDHCPDQHPKQSHSRIDEKELVKIADSYEAVSKALVSDDLSSAKSAANSLSKTANQKNQPTLANAAEKVAILRECGIEIVPSPAEFAPTVKKVLN